MFRERNTCKIVYNCKLVYNHIRDTFAPFLATATTGLSGYKANNSIQGYVASGGLADS
jgi:hypothetical protein